MEILNESEQHAIAYAYDNLKRDEFLNRINVYICEKIENVRLQERLVASATESFERLLDNKTKPGRKAKHAQELFAETKNEVV